MHPLKEMRQSISIIRRCTAAAAANWRKSGGGKPQRPSRQSEQWRGLFLQQLSARGALRPGTWPASQSQWPSSAMSEHAAIVCHVFLWPRPLAATTEASDCTEEDRNQVPASIHRYRCGLSKRILGDS
jgi:hypothetical protein